MSNSILGCLTWQLWTILFIYQCNKTH